MIVQNSQNENDSSLLNSLLHVSLPTSEKYKKNLYFFMMNENKQTSLQTQGSFYYKIY